MTSKRLHNYDDILDRWQAGATTSAIAEALGIGEPSVRQIVCQMRKQGDPRAAKHGRTPPALPKASLAGAGWTEERIAEAERLFGEGNSAAQVAAAIGGGITRNAVIGMAHRRGWTGGKPPRIALGRRAPSRGNRSYHARKSAKPPAARPRPARPVPIENLAVPVSRDVALMDLAASDCRWPNGKGPFTFCGQRAHGGGSYCEYHSRLAYVPATAGNVSRLQTAFWL